MLALQGKIGQYLAYTKVMQIRQKVPQTKKTFEPRLALPGPSFTMYGVA
jgi:hypothetical protein